jgi:tetratricopeptide (TPR) repeat protein/4-amino-4-deoxy-L-arabinose transferase-like glycosyltransferase
MPLVLNYATSINNPDSGLYLAQGLNLAASGEYSDLGEEPDILRPPLIPMLFALAFRAQGGSESVALFVMKLFGVLAVSVYCALGERFFGRYTGVMGGLLIATSSYLTYYLFGAIMLDGPQATMFGVFLYSLLCGLQTGRLAWYLAAGIGLAGGFAIKESAIWWCLLPVLAFLLLQEFRIRRTAIGLLLLYTPFFLAAGLWWGYVYHVSGTIYLIGSGRTLVLQNMLRVGQSLSLPVLLLGTAAAIVGVFAAIKLVSIDRIKNPVFWRRASVASGWLLLLIYFAAAGTAPSASQYLDYYELHIRAIVVANPVWWCFIPCWIIFAWVLRHSPAARVVMLSLTLNLPLISVLLRWQNQPRNLMSLFMVSCVVVAAVVGIGWREILQLATRQGAYRRGAIMAAVAAVVAVCIALLLWNSQIGRSVTSRYGAAAVSIPGANCAQWIRKQVEPGSRIAMTALYDESLYFLMEGTKFDVFRINPESSFLALTPEGRLFAENTIYISVRQSLAPGQRPYRFLDERTWLASLRKENADYFVYEGTMNSVVGSFAALEYFDQNPGLRLICGDRSRNVVTAVYQVEQSLLRGTGDTYLDPGTLEYLEQDVQEQEEALRGAALYDAVGSRIHISSESNASQAAAYRGIADSYWEADRPKSAVFYATRAAVLDTDALDGERTSELVAHWVANMKTDGWSAAALAKHYANIGRAEEASAAYAHAVENVNREYGLYSALNDGLAQSGELPLRIALNEQASADWPARKSLFPTLTSLHIANNDPLAAQKTAGQWLYYYGNDVQTYLDLARVYAWHGQFEDARTVLFTAQAQWPQNADIVINLAEGYMAQARYKEAAATLENAMKIIAHDTRLYASLAGLQYELGSVADAKAVLLAWQAVAPDSAAPLMQLGLIELHEGSGLDRSGP